MYSSTLSPASDWARSSGAPEVMLSANTTLSIASITAPRDGLSAQLMASARNSTATIRLASASFAYAVSAASK